MSDCMHQTVNVENKDQDQSIAICLNMWKQKGKKKKKESSMSDKRKAQRIVASFFKKDAMLLHQDTGNNKFYVLKTKKSPKTRPTPSKLGEPFAEKGERVNVLQQDGSFKKMPFDPGKMEPAGEKKSV